MEVEQLIRENVQLIGKTSKGWESCVHTGCDHGKKGPRAGFNFSGQTIGFQCFNCSAKAVLNCDENRRIPKKFRSILEDFGIDKSTLDKLDFYLFQKNSRNFSTDSEKERQVISIIPKSIPLPSDFILLEDCKDTKFREICEAYLKDQRKLDPNDYPYMVCNHSKNLAMKKWKDRLIIPILHDDKLVFYQGRDMTGKSDTKYLNASNSELDRGRIISDYDILFEDHDDPLYVVEGWFDAQLLGGIALFGNNIEPAQRSWLAKSYRRKVFIPDRYGEGSIDSLAQNERRTAALQALDAGWSISVPYAKLDSRIKDVTDIVNTYGKLFAIKQIKKYTTNSKMEGEIMLGMLTS